MKTRNPVSHKPLNFFVLFIGLAPRVSQRTQGYKNA